MRVDATGNVGIGTALPVVGPGLVNITAFAASGSQFNVTSTNVRGDLFASESAAEVILRAFSNHPLTFRTNNTECMRIGTSGQVTVGAGTAGAPVVSTTGDTNTGIFYPAADTVAISTGGVARFTVGNAGIVSRVYSAASDTSISVDPSLYDQYVWTALAGTLTFNASTTGSPENGTKLIFRIKDNGTTRTLTWTTSGTGSYRAIGVTLPTATTANKVIYVGCIYNSTEGFWDVVAVQIQV